MRTLIACVLVMLVLAVPAHSNFGEIFYYPDGSFPDGWAWTGDSRGGGSFEVQGRVFTHTSTGAVHYFRHTSTQGMGWYYVQVRDMCWDFAWRIAPSSPLSGECLRIRHTCEWGPWCVVVSRMDWDTLDASQYPDGQYMWHNGTETIKHQLWLGGDALSGFHAFEIEDYGNHLVVKLSGYWPYIVSNDVFGDGYVGLGCGAVVSGVPGFDEITYCDFTAVEEASWGRIKALFR